ncbi:MAG: tRNA pseudouridine(55) synthase TruB [Bacilli bacterium]|jgi:tRNA pseudouridine55 synthase|nr:tRNA pseudouridine(55) synthase TruB [Bacilli bacterium]
MESGLLLLDKEAGMTSRAVDNRLQKEFGTKRVGHLGTLDPFATGLLLVGVGRGTKFLPYIDDSRKSYLATLKLGETTSSLDPDTPVIAKKSVQSLTNGDIVEAFSSFKGKGEQIPPMTSAIKVNGEPLYKAAHEGKVVERKPRSVEIFSLNLIEMKDNLIVFSTTVSRGTYIRVLGSDIAERLGTVGYLTSLRRLSLGPFLVADAKKLDAIGKEPFIDGTLAITTMKHVEIDEEDLNRARNGAPFDLAEDYGAKVLLTLHGEAIAVYRRFADTHYRAERGLF